MTGRFRGRFDWCRFAATITLLTAVPLAAAPLDGPRPAGHVLDTVGLLAPEDVAVVERVAEGVAAASGGNLMVVVTATTGGSSSGGGASGSW